MNSHDMDVVAAFVAALAEHLGPARWALWFKPHVDVRLEGDRVTLVVRDPFYLEYLRQNFRADVLRACQEIRGSDTSVHYALAEPRQAEGATAPAIAPAPVPVAVTAPAEQVAPTTPDVVEPGNTTAEPPTGPSTLLMVRPSAAAAATTRRPFSNFESFIGGPQSRMAESSARLAADEPGRLSPLVIYGPTGVGKTHLLEAIWSRSRVARRQATLIYLKAEQFTTQFLEAVRGTGMPAFRRRYRGAHLLILDDLQFFASKPATLQELVHTIDTVHNGGGQIVFAADRSPAELTGLGPELASRLQGGLSCRLDAPDEATRRGILRRFAREARLELPGDVEEMIAARLSGDGRELRGAIHRLRVVVEAYGQPIDMNVAREALADLFQAAEKPLMLPDIEKAVCDAFGLERAALKTDGRSKSIAHSRMLAMFLAREWTRAAYSEIGTYFGQRAHSTAISAHSKVGRWREEQTELRIGGKAVSVDEAVRRVEARLRIG